MKPQGIQAPKGVGQYETLRNQLPALRLYTIDRDSGPRPRHCMHANPNKLHANCMYFACKSQGFACKLQGFACNLQGFTCKLPGFACKSHRFPCKLRGFARICLQIINFPCKSVWSEGVSIHFAFVFMYFLNCLDFTRVC